MGSPYFRKGKKPPDQLLQNSVFVVPVEINMLQV